ncbi:hypothetical protein [Lentzea sp. E54]|uniref:hypothetical protein n=1 Tax=Lentzea xerophila TaxID=3435883 RepID=UPI003DA255CB
MAETTSKATDDVAACAGMWQGLLHAEERLRAALAGGVDHSAVYYLVRDLQGLAWRIDSKAEKLAPDVRGDIHKCRDSALYLSMREDVASIVSSVFEAALRIEGAAKCVVANAPVCLLSHGQNLRKDADDARKHLLSWLDGYVSVTRSWVSALGIKSVTASSSVEWGTLMALGNLHDGVTTHGTGRYGWSSDYGQHDRTESLTVHTRLDSVSRLELWPRSDMDFGFPKAVTVSKALPDGTWEPIASAGNLVRPERGSYVLPLPKTSSHDGKYRVDFTSLYDQGGTLYVAQLQELVLS